MAYKQIVDQLQTILSLIDGIGQVHIYQRYVRNPDALKTVFEDKSTSTIRSWMISRISMESEQITNLGNVIIHTFALRGYLSLSDVNMSEIEFQEIIESVRDAFAPQTNLNLTCELTRPVQFGAIGYAELGGHLCHFAEGTIEVQELLNT